MLHPSNKQSTTPEPVQQPSTTSRNTTKPLPPTGINRKCESKTIARINDYEEIWRLLLSAYRNSARQMWKSTTERRYRSYLEAVGKGLYHGKQAQWKLAKTQIQLARRNRAHVPIISRSIWIRQGYILRIDLYLRRD